MGAQTIYVDILPEHKENGGLAETDPEEIMAPATERLTALESDRKFHWLAILGLVAWLTWASSTVVSMSKDLEKIKQAQKDAGKEIVGSLLAPKSDDQLRASLASVSAVILNAKAEGIKPKAEKVTTLGAAMETVLTKHPDLPQAWDAAMQLVSFRSQSNGKILPSCLDHYSNSSMSNHIGPDLLEDTIEAYDCTLGLDDLDNFAEAKITKTWLERPSDSRTPIRFILHNARIVYHGGSTIPFSSIACQNCSFEFEGQGKPTMPVQQMTRQLLLANDYSKLHFDVRS